MTTAADPPLDAPIGIDEFIEAMRSLGDAKTVVERGLIADLEDAAVRLARSAGVEDASGTGFAARWQDVLETASQSVAADLLGPDTIRQAGRVGSRVARLSSSVRVREAPVAKVEVSVSASRGTRDAIDAVEEEIHKAAMSTVASSEVELGDPPGWWRSAGLARPVAAVAFGAAAYWLATSLELGGPIPIVGAVVVGMAVWLAVGAAVAASGRRWGSTAVTRHRDELSGVVARELDRRIGRPLRDALRIRAALGAALTEFELVRSSLDPPSVR